MICCYIRKFASTSITIPHQKGGVTGIYTSGKRIRSNQMFYQVMICCYIIKIASTGITSHTRRVVLQVSIQVGNASEAITCFTNPRPEGWCYRYPNMFKQIANDLLSNHEAFMIVVLICFDCSATTGNKS